ncbi:hypothetical protein GE21DRAFT_1351240, partial [Neurospora crassa]
YKISFCFPFLIQTCRLTRDANHEIRFPSIAGVGGDSFNAIWAIFFVPLHSKFLGPPFKRTCCSGPVTYCTPLPWFLDMSLPLMFLIFLRALGAVCHGVTLWFAFSHFAFYSAASDRVDGGETVNRACGEGGKEEKKGGKYPEPGVIYHHASGLSSDLGSRPYSPWETKDLSVCDGVFQNTHKRH